MPQLLEQTIKMFQDGLTGPAQDKIVEQGVKNIDTWMNRLEKEDFRGAKVIHENLGKLKQHLGADKIDSAAIGDLLKTLGEETVRAAGQADGKQTESIKSLGESLSKAANLK